MIKSSDVKMIISFSDGSVGDIGTIYKASSWVRLPDTSKSYHYFDSNTNKSIHKKTVWNIANRAHMKESDFVIKSGFIRVPESPKHVWVKLL